MIIASPKGRKAIQLRESTDHQVYLAILDEPRDIWINGKRCLFTDEIPASLWNDVEDAIDVFEEGNNDLELIGDEPYEVYEKHVYGDTIRIVREVDMRSYWDLRKSWQAEISRANEFYVSELYSKFVKWNNGRDDREEYESAEEEPLEFALWLIDELLKELNKKYR